MGRGRRIFSDEEVREGSMRISREKEIEEYFEQGDRRRRLETELGGGGGKNM